MDLRLYYNIYSSYACNIERPPVLFEARSRSDLGISFGGVPSVYLHNGAPTNKSVFHIRSLHSKQLVKIPILIHNVIYNTICTGIVASCMFFF
jgi:hypothetical protein